MKKVFLLLALSIFFVGCGKTDQPKNNEDSIAEAGGSNEQVERTEKIESKVGTWKTAQTIQPFFYNEVSSEEGTEVLPFTNPGDMKTALLAGDLDFTGTTWVTAIMAKSKGEPVKIVASMTEKCSALVVGADSGIESTADLKGKTLAYVPGTMHHILLLEVLDKAGLDPNKDVTLVNIDFFDMGQALASGRIDGFLSGEPYPSMAVADGYGKVLEYPYFDDSIGYINAAMMTTEDVLKNEPEKIKHLIKLHKDSTEFLMTNKDAWVEKAASFGTDAKYIEKSLDNIDLSWDITEKNIEQVKTLANKMKELGIIDEVPNIDEMFDLSFLEDLR